MLSASDRTIRKLYHFIFNMSCDPLNLRAMTNKEKDETGQEKEVNELFVTELKMQYNIELDNKKNLETKANGIISISGTVAALLFGFGTFLINKLGPSYDYFSFVVIMLMLSISSVVVSIVLSIAASRIQEYYVAMDHTPFYQNNEIKIEVLQQFCDANKNTFNHHMAKTYLTCIEHNAHINEKKATYILISQIIFFCGVVLLPILLAVLFSNYPDTTGNK